MAKKFIPTSKPVGVIIKKYTPHIKIENDPQITELVYIGSSVFKDQQEAKDYAEAQIAFIYATGTYDKYWIEQ